MRIAICNIKMPIIHNEEDVIRTAQDMVRSDCIFAKNFEIYKQSLDARRKGNIHYVYTVTAEADTVSGHSDNIKVIKDDDAIKIPEKTLKSRPVVVGSGPCGLFAAYVLAESKNPPIILERGDCVDIRAEKIKKFWESGTLDKNSNIQFGEGGAGTFSDGKLTTRIGDIRQRFVLETFVKFGAPRDILYKAKPHIGTDVLRCVIKNMREYLKENGAEIRFNSCVTGFEIKNNKLKSVTVNGSERLECDRLILATGHSCRDTYEEIVRLGIDVEPKAFAIGVRIEHSQKFIDMLQYGNVKGLSPADYRVVYNGKDRSCYSFCMCPGGTVVNASSEEGMLAVNGMSNHMRDGENANSALVVTVGPNDYKNGVLGGVEFQRKYERLSFLTGGGNNSVPVQLARDFMKNRPSERIGNVKPSVASGYLPTDLRKCLPKYVSDTLSDGLSDFEQRLNGFASGGAVLCGIESRTSAPVRIIRNEGLQCPKALGVYPSGEGAGFAGGIMSAAIDGIRCAFAILDEN